MFDMSTSGTSSAISSVVNGMLKSSSRRNELDTGFCVSLLTMSLILATTSADTLWVPYLSSQYIVHIRYICLTLNAGQIFLLICSRVFLLLCGMIRKSTACLMNFSSSQDVPLLQPPQSISQVHKAQTSHILHLKMCNILVVEAYY